MPFVLDASVSAAWAFHDEEHPVADAALDLLRGNGALAPALWWFERRNILVVNERRKRLSEGESHAFLRDLARLPIQMDRAPEEIDSLRLARTQVVSRIFRTFHQATAPVAEIWTA